MIIRRRIVMAIPEEFTVASVAAASKDIDAPYRDFVISTEP